MRDVELVWPPSDEDLDAFTVVPLADESAAPPRLKPTFGDCRARGTAPRVRPLVVPMEPLEPLAAQAEKDDAPATDEPPPIPVPAVPNVVELAPAPVASPAVVATKAGPAPMSLLSVARLRDLEPSLAGQSASLAVLVAAACLVVAVVQYQAISFVTNETSASASSVEPPPLPPQLAMTELAPGVSLEKPAPRTTATRRPAPQAPPMAAPPVPPVAAPAPAPASAAPARSRPAPPSRSVADRPSLTAASPASTQHGAPSATRVTVAVRDVGVAPPRVVPTAAPTLTARAEPAAAPVPTPATLPPPASVSASASPSEPLAAAAAPVRPVAAVLTSASADEADIRSTLSRFRTAYSQLDASAARDVWPSVDRRALERAFQSLKSQELRFDRCSLTVTGARAQAACTGRAIYVPRIGDQSPRFSSREWTFELQKAAERWTIASARSL